MEGDVERDSEIFPKFVVHLVFSGHSLSTAHAVPTFLTVLPLSLDTEQFNKGDMVSREPQVFPSRNGGKQRST